MSFSSLLFVFLLIYNYHQQLIIFLIIIINNQFIEKWELRMKDCKFHRTEIGKVKCACVEGDKKKDIKVN